MSLATDGGYAQQDNLDKAKALGAEHVAFHKKKGLTIEAMTGERWLYYKLKRFRAGIEAGISYLKRCFGLSRCNWKGLAHYQAYVLVEHLRPQSAAPGTKTARCDVVGNPSDIHTIPSQWLGR